VGLAMQLLRRGASGVMVSAGAKPVCGTDPLAGFRTPGR